MLQLKVFDVTKKYASVFICALRKQLCPIFFSGLFGSKTQGFPLHFLDYTLNQTQFILTSLLRAKY